MAFLKDRRVQIGAGALLVVGVAGVFLVTRVPTHEVSGVLAAPECGGGYAIDSSQVELRNEKNEIIGSAHTSENKIPMFEDLGCVVDFTVPDVPETKFYSIKIGGHEGPNYSLSQLRDDDWKMTLGLEDAATTFPAPGHDEMCEVAYEINDALNDTDYFNDDADQWYSDILDAATRLRMMGAGHAMKGRDDLATEIAEVTDPLLAPLRRLATGILISNLSGKLTDVVEPTNHVPDGELDCNGWSEVSYVSGG